MTKSPLNQVSATKCAGGWVRFFEHFSSACQCTMKFSVFVPPQAETEPVPVLYWLSGLTCTAENFTTKAGAQRYAAEHGILIVAPDTSPRGVEIAGEEDSWDFGSGAGFYLDATEEPWASHYRMETYVTHELPALVEEHFPVIPGKAAVSGHSMGGHGALVLSLRHPGLYQSVSAFAPICAPVECPWGEKAFGGYLGDDRTRWEAYDASKLLEKAEEALPMLVDQGTEDSFLDVQLKPERLQAVCDTKGHTLELRMQEGYDHSYYFIASFIGEHIAFHAKALKS